MPGPGESADPFMMELFRAELDTHLPALSEGLLSLEKDGHQPKRLEAMMRAAHSIKGAARIVGVEAAVRVAHVMEDCLVAAQKSEITLNVDAIDVLLRGVDVLTRVGQGAEAPGEEVLSELVNALTAVREGRALVKHPEPAPAPAQDATLLRPEDLDPKGGERLRQDYLGLRQGGSTVFRLDFASVREVSPSSLALLALMARLPCVDGSPPRLEVVQAPEAVGEMLRLTRLASYFVSPPGQER
jgi:two-component system sensor histidine kinase and response regulator WspE